jgi:hypothetical protein
MARILVVANKTAESPELRGALASRREGNTFFLVVPASGGSGLEKAADPDAAVDHTKPHFEAALAALRKDGLEIDGTVGDTDPLAAVQDALNFGDYDEVIVSTLPARASKWLKMDLPSRVERVSGLPVTHIETKQKD